VWTMQIRHFSNADGDFARRRLSDALRKDVDGNAPSDCGVRMGLSVICTLSAVRSYERSLGLRLRRLATALTVPT
jgi:hypothetical protein